MKKMHTFRFAIALIDKIRAIAAKQNRTMTNLIETILIKFVDDNEKNNIN